MLRALLEKLRAWSPVRDTRGSEIIELAVSLPLLIVFAMGVYDFSSAFILKQKLTHITEEAARIAANQPTSDLSSGIFCPSSICAIRDVVSQALTTAGVNDCGLGSATPAKAALTWTFTASNGNCSGLTLAVNRGVIYGATLATPFQPGYTIEATSVTIKYPYQWQFNKAINLIAPGANYASGLIQSVATMQNLN
jgi:Flp pilus assembly protein TadG